MVNRTAGQQQEEDGSAAAAGDGSTQQATTTTTTTTTASADDNGSAAYRGIHGSYFVDKGDFFATLEHFFPRKTWQQMDQLRSDIGRQFRSGGFVDVAVLLGGSFYPCSSSFVRLLREQHTDEVLQTTEKLRANLKLYSTTGSQGSGMSVVALKQCLRSAIGDATSYPTLQRYIALGLNEPYDEAAGDLEHEIQEVPEVAQEFHHHGLGGGSRPKRSISRRGSIKFIVAPRRASVDGGRMGAGVTRTVDVEDFADNVLKHLIKPDDLYNLNAVPVIVSEGPATTSFITRKPSYITQRRSSMRVRRFRRLSVVSDMEAAPAGASMRAMEEIASHAKPMRADVLLVSTKLLKVNQFMEQSKIQLARHKKQMELRLDKLKKAVHAGGILDVLHHFRAAAHQPQKKAPKELVRWR